MRLFELRACRQEFYDCPDNGKTHICDTYETVAFAVNDDTTLKTMAADLNKGFGGNYWTKTRSDALRRLHPGYDSDLDAEYKVVEVTDLILTPNVKG